MRWICDGRPSIVLGSYVTTDQLQQFGCFLIHIGEFTWKLVLNICYERLIRLLVRIEMRSGSCAGYYATVRIQGRYGEIYVQEVRQNSIFGAPIGVMRWGHTLIAVSIFFHETYFQADGKPMKRTNHFTSLCQMTVQLSRSRKSFIEEYFDQTEDLPYELADVTQSTRKTYDLMSNGRSFAKTGAIS